MITRFSLRPPHTDTRSEARSSPAVGLLRASLKMFAAAPFAALSGRAGGGCPRTLT
jgi:hypothetical protein